MSREQVQKTAREVQKENLYFYIYDRMKSGYSPAQITLKFKISKQSINYYTKRLEAIGLIKKVGYGTWDIIEEVDEQGFKEVQKIEKSKLFSLGTSERPITNLHALQIKIPILSGKILGKEWEVKEKLRNWTPKYLKLKELGGLTIKNNNNKSLTVLGKSRNITNVDEVHKLVRAILMGIGGYFKSKYNVTLDTINAEVKNIDLATEDKESECMRGNGEKFLLKFNKNCEKILPADKDKPSKAFIDGTPFKFSAETNDLDWKREYLNMPFNIKHLCFSLPMLEEYNKNLKLHIQVQLEQLNTQKEIQSLLSQLKNKL